MIVAQVCDRFCKGGLVAIGVMLGATVLGVVLGVNLNPHWLGAAVLAVALAPMLGALPRLTDAAITLDRLNDTDELISTAWLIRDHSDPWSAQLVAMAESASRSMALPGASGKHGWRPLGAIALALAAITLAGNLIQDRAASQRTGALASTASAERPAPGNRSVIPVTPRIASAEPETHLPDRSALLPDPRNGVGQSRNSVGDDARGAGRATAAIVNQDQPHAFPVAPVATRPGDADGFGDGVAMLNANGGADARGAVSSQAPEPAAPWLSPTWPAAQTAVDQALRAGDYPDTYRPLIRAYFER